jgi:sulfite dehydrogenase (cytochrome) subunit B
MKTLRSAAAVAVMLLALPALAGEEKFRLKEAPGVDKVRANCVACHSLDYVALNSPFLDHKGWEATVAKMNKAFGAPIKPEDAGPIADYLARNYGKR